MLCSSPESRLHLQSRKGRIYWTPGRRRIAWQASEARTLQGRAWRPGPLGQLGPLWLPPSAPTTRDAGHEPVKIRHSHETWLIR